MEKMSERQWQRVDVLKRLESGNLTVGEAAQILVLSSRQVQRIRWTVVDEGEKGVIHRNTGRAPSNRLCDEVREKVIGLRRGKYDKFNDQHFSEKLLSVESLKVSPRTVRRILRKAGIESVRKHRSPKHRRRRERKPQAGLMLLWDGSDHDWLEGRGPRLCLMGAIDDATSELMPGAHFVTEECSAGYLRVLLTLAKEKGLPLSIYMDQHGSLRRNDDYWTLDEELRGEQDQTHVGKALKALGIKVIYALSPQAKGRVERLWGTLQDRLVSELRLNQTKTVEEANTVLERMRPEHNARFAIAASDSTPAWRPVRTDLDLNRACSFYYETEVRNDNTARFGKVVVDIPPGPQGRSYAKARVELRQLLDGSWRVYHKDVLIATGATTKGGELRAQPQRKRSAASRAFRKSVHEVETLVSKRPRGRAQPSFCGQPEERLPTKTPRRLTRPLPFNFYIKKGIRKKPSRG